MNNTGTCPDSDIKFTCVLPHFVALCPVLLYIIAQSYRTGIALISVRHLSPPTLCIYPALATRYGTCHHHQPTACQTGGKVNLPRELMEKLKTVLPLGSPILAPSGDYVVVAPSCDYSQPVSAKSTNRIRCFTLRTVLLPTGVK